MAKSTSSGKTTKRPESRPANQLQPPKVYTYGPLSKKFYIYHEVTAKGGVFYRLEKGTSNSEHAYNLAPNFKYVVIRHDLGIHSMLIVQKMRQSDAYGVPDPFDDPVPHSECTCGPGFDTASPCPDGHVMDCNTPGTTLCVIRDLPKAGDRDGQEKKKQKKK